jgi:hypothetical protein
MAPMNSKNAAFSQMLRRTKSRRPRSDRDESYSTFLRVGDPDQVG